MQDSIDPLDHDLFDPEAEDVAQGIAHEADSEGRASVEHHLRRRKQAYSAVFIDGTATTDDAQFVLDDLAWFCCAHSPQWHDNPREQDRNVARREVYQRIAEAAGLDVNVQMRRYFDNQPN